MMRLQCFTGLAHIGLSAFFLLLTTLHAENHPVAQHNEAVHLTDAPTIPKDRKEKSQTPYSFNPDKLAFGKHDWAYYIADVGEVPPIPKNMSEILNEQCPFHPDKKVGDTHILVLIPKTVDGHPFCLNFLPLLIKSPHHTPPARFYSYSDELRSKIGEVKISEPYWVLMTKDIIPSSRAKSYEELKKLILKTPDYEIPSTLEATTSIIMHFFKTGEYIYNSTLWTYTCCKEPFSFS